MIDFTSRLKLQFIGASQERSRQTETDLLQAAEQLVEQGDPDQFSSRALAARAGYSIGTINRRFAALDNVFMQVLLNRRQKHRDRCVRLIEGFDASRPLRELLTALVDHHFAMIGKVNPRVMRFFESRALRRIDQPWMYFHYIDVLIPAFEAATERDCTGTFRRMSPGERSMALRACLIFIDRPFIEMDPIAGSAEHRALAIDNMARLLGA